MSKAQRQAGILLTYLNEAVKILTVLLYTPLLLRLLGQGEYGVYQLVTALVANLGLLHLGFGGAYLRFFARCEGEEALARLNGMFLLIFTALAGVSLACGAWLGANAPLVFGPGLTGPELETAKKLLGILTVNLAMTLLNTPQDCYLAARERFGYQQLLRLAQNLLSPFLTLPLLLLGYGSAALGWVSAGLTGVVLLTNLHHCRHGLGMPFCFRGLAWGQLGELWGFAFFLFLNQFIDQINWSIDRFLLGRMAGTAAVAVYGIGAQINTLYTQLSTAIAAVFAPKVHRLAGDNGRLTCLMTQVGGLQLPVLLLALTGFFFLGRPFLRLWAGEDYRDSYAVALVLMAPMTVPLMQNIGIEIQRAKNKHQARSLVYAALAVANLALTLVLIPGWGPVGAAGATAVTQAVGTIFFMNWYYHRKIGLNMPAFWKKMGNVFLPYLPVMFLGGLVFSRWKPQSWGGLLAAAVIYSLAFFLVFLRNAKKEGQA